jgi:recombination protein RecT
LAGKTLIQQATSTNAAAPAASTALAQKGAQSSTAILNGILDGEGYRKRFEEVLGKRAPQFVSSIISIVNNDSMLRKVVASAPQTIITSALQAAALDLPINPQLGMAYVVPFKNTVKGPDGKPIKDENGYNKTRDEATMIIGWKGIVQLAQRTGVYKFINVGVVYEGETVVDNRITGEIHIEGEKKSETPIGYFAYFQLLNGFEKARAWTREEMARHEEKNRKGKYMTQAWRDNFDAMALKTAIKDLLTKWGPLSIDYHTATPEMIKASESLQEALSNDEDAPIEAEGVISESAAPIVDPETGEVKVES